MNNPRRIQRHLVRALAAGALLAAAALPLAIATAASAAAPPVLSTFVTTPGSIGAGGSGTVTFTGTGFAHDGGTYSLATTAAGVTFSSVTETSTTAGTADVTTSATTAPGSYGVTLTDDNGTSAALPGVLVINADPTVTGISISSVAQSQTTGTATLTGTFAAGATATVTNATNGTTINNTLTYATPTTLTGTISGINSTNGKAATVGAYTITVTNTDGGSGSLSGAFSVTASGITNVSPSELATTATATPITIAGAGFEPGATVNVSVCTNTTVVSGDTVVVSPTEITTAVTTAAGSGSCTVTVQNPTVGNGGNNATIALATALGVGVEATGGAVVTATTLSPNQAIVPGTSGTTPETLTITGSGFGSGSVIQAFNGTTHDTAVTFTSTVNAAGTTITATVAVGSGAIAGADTIEVLNNAVASAPSATAFTVAGPSLTAVTPTDLAVNAPVGTVLTFTGAGLNSSATVAVGGGTGVAGVFAVTSPTTATYSVTTSPSTVGTATFTVSQTVSAGVTVTGTVFDVSIDALPSVTSLVNTKTSVDQVGAGAVTLPITITGTGFETGVTVGSFVNAYGVADSGVTFALGTATATTINGTVTISATDANLSDGFTIKNPDGGSYTVTGFTANKSLFIAPAPTITSVTPETGAASATTSFQIAGTNFATGAIVTLSPANGTCGVTTVSSSTTLAVTCTLGLAGVTPTSLVVTNPNGGQVTSSPILGAATPPAPVFHVSGAHGAAVAGKTVTITISGTGFYGQPKVTAAGYKFGVTKDSGTLLTVRVTAKAGLSGEHELTVSEGGHSGKAGFNTKK